MPRPSIIILLLALSLISLSGRSHSYPIRTAAHPSSQGEVLVELEESAATRSSADLEVLLGGRVIDSLPEIRTVRLALDPSETIEHALLRLEATPGVARVEANLLVLGSAVNDAYYGAQASYLELIEAPQAWAVTAGDESVIVAVLDSGIDLDHPDLIGKIWTNPYEIEANAIDDDENGCVDDIHGCSFVTTMTSDPGCAEPSSGQVADDNGHGTFVSGIIAATGNNTIGVTGAAPGVTVLPVKILDCFGNGSAVEAAKGVLYAAKAGARVINISFSADGDSFTMANALREAHDRHGVVIVAASGNEGEQTITFPARLPETIAVGAAGAVEGRDLRSPFSDWGAGVDVVAPGLNIVSTVPAALCGERWHCLADQPYAISSGTSFAAPLVSSLAALIISRNPNLHPETVRSIILRTAEPLPDGDTTGWDGAGRIRMRLALDQKRYQIGAPGIVTE